MLLHENSAQRHAQLTQRERIEAEQLYQKLNEQAALRTPRRGILHIRRIVAFASCTSKEYGV